MNVMMQVRSGVQGDCCVCSSSAHSPQAVGVACVGGFGSRLWLTACKAWLLFKKIDHSQLFGRVERRRHPNKIPGINLSVLFVAQSPRWNYWCGAHIPAFSPLHALSVPTQSLRDLLTTISLLLASVNSPRAPIRTSPPPVCSACTFLATFAKGRGT